MLATMLAVQNAMKRKADAEKDDDNVTDNRVKQPKVGPSAFPFGSGKKKDVGVIGVSTLRSMLSRNESLIGVTHLTIDDGDKQVKSYDNVLVSIPSLVGLTIRHSRKFPIEEFCKLNPQVERLELKNDTEWRIDANLLQSIDEALPELKHLEIQFCFTHSRYYDFGPKRFKKLKSLQICSRGKAFSHAFAFVNCSGDELERFEIYVYGKCKRIIDKSFPKKLAAYKNLKYLHISSWLDNKQLAEVVKYVSPKIEHFEFNQGEVTQKGLLELITSCKELRKIELNQGRKKVYDEDIEKFCEPLKKKKGFAGWQFDSEGATIIIEKKSENWIDWSIFRPTRDSKTKSQPFYKRNKRNNSWIKAKKVIFASC